MKQYIIVLIKQYIVVLMKHYITVLHFFFNPCCRRVHGVPVCGSLGAACEGQRGRLVEHGHPRRLRLQGQAWRLPGSDWKVRLGIDVKIGMLSQRPWEPG